MELLLGLLSIKGLAARAMQWLPLMSANYDSVAEILQERFREPQIIISVDMDEILKIQAGTVGN